MKYTPNSFVSKQDHFPVPGGQIQIRPFVEVPDAFVVDAGARPLNDRQLDYLRGAGITLAKHIYEARIPASITIADGKMFEHVRDEKTVRETRVLDSLIHMGRAVENVSKDVIPIGVFFGENGNLWTMLNAVLPAELCFVHKSRSVKMYHAITSLSPKERAAKCEQALQIYHGLTAKGAAL